MYIHFLSFAVSIFLILYMTILTHSSMQSEINRPITTVLFAVQPTLFKNRIEFNNITVHHRSCYNWYNHLVDYFTSTELDEDKTKDKPEDRDDSGFTQFLITFSNIELEYTPILLPSKMFITAALFEVRLCAREQKEQKKRRKKHLFYL